MTDRDKEIEEASVDYQMSTRPNAIGGDAFADLVYKANINPSFIAGAKWSDEHPRKGLVDINKACEFWEEEFTYPTMTQEERDWYKKKVEEFRKAIEL